MNAGPLRRSVSFTRIYAAPRATVFAAWTQAEHLARWWGPKGFTNPRCEMDARVGGELYIVMLSPDGFEYPMRGRVVGLQAPERLHFSFQAVDAAGTVLLEGETRVVFEDLGQETRITVESTAAGSKPGVARMLEGMEAGWSQSLDKLKSMLAGG